MARKRKLYPVKDPYRLFIMGWLAGGLMHEPSLINAAILAGTTLVFMLDMKKYRHYFKG